MKHLISLCTIACFAALRLSSQVLVPNATANYMSASPEATGAQKQSSIPVNQSTGAAQIGVPLANLSGTTTSISYSLTYDASGRKADELAPWTGWGWNLVGGGQINRAVKGIQDEYDGCIDHMYANQNGYEELIVWDWNYTATDPVYVNNLPNYGSSIVEDEHFANEPQHFQPDEFYFNFNGRSGMFLLNESGQATMIPYQNLKVEYQPCLHWFKVIDESGYEYKFDLATTTEFGIQPYNENSKAATTWYLTTIKNPYGETEFTFDYDNAKSNYQSNHVKIKSSYYGSADCPPDDVNSSEFYNGYGYRRIESVTSINGSKIEFHSNLSRIDITTDKSLDEVWIYDTNGDVISKVLLDYDYFKNEFYGNERLKLTGIRSQNQSGDIQPVSSFEYDESLPVVQNELIAGKDHWGYFNGLNMASVEDLHVSGGSRRVNPDYNQIGILKEVISATGAKSIIEYETNTYSESPNGLVVNEPPLTPITISCSITADESHYYDIINPIQTPWTFSGPYGGMFPNGYEYPAPNCGLGYTFHNPNFNYVVGPEVGSDGQFDPEDDTDVDHPVNNSNTDEIDQEIAYVPVGRTRTSFKLFTVDQTQTISITGSIAPSFCETHLSSVKLINANAPYNVIWQQTGNSTSASAVSHSETLALGTYKLQCTVAYPFFDNVAPDYEPNNFDDAPRTTNAAFVLTPLVVPSPGNGSNYCGGLRVKSVTTDDGDADQSNNSITKYEYNWHNQNAVSSGYLLSNPKYTMEIGWYYEQYKRTGSGCGGGLQLCHGCDLTQYISSGINSLISANGAFQTYRNVRTKTCSSNSVCDQGWTDQVFSLEPSTNANPAIQETAPYKSWLTGLPLETKVYKQNGDLISSSVNGYDHLIASPAEVKGIKAGVTHIKSAAPNEPQCENNNHDCSYEFTYDILNYKYYSELYAPITSLARIYDQDNPSDFIETNTTYEYLSAITGSPSKVITQISDPLKPFTVQKIKYVGDYVVSANGDDMATALNYLINTGEFALSTPVETITLQGTSLNDLKVIGGSINTFKMQDGKVVTDATYKLELATPIDVLSFTMSSISGSNFVMNSSYRKIAHIASYDSEERPTSSQKENDILTTVIRDYTDGRVVAEVVNATPEKCAYTSFETDNGGGWTYNNQWTYSLSSSILGFQLAGAKTGKKLYAYQGGSITRQVQPGSYIISMWSNTPAFSLSVNGQVQTRVVEQDGEDLMSWAYYEYVITCNVVSNISIGGSNGHYIDELRLYPADASMKTTAYNSDGTVRSSCGVNNRVTTYLYDNWKRLEWTLDDNWEILTHHEYHIKNQNDPSDHSWTKEQVVMEEGMTKDDVLNATASDESVVTTITYADGLGRPLQSFAVRQCSHEFKDIVTFHQYDALGRESKKYLPFTSGLFNDGEYIADPVAEVMDFYDSTPRVAETEYPFAETEYEASPLGRPLRLGNVGEEWQLNTTHTINSLILLNNANEVLLWTGNQNYANAMDDTMPLYYPANTLIKKEVEDEHGQKMWEYTNALGQVVCKRVKVWAAGAANSPYTYALGNGEINNNEPEKADASNRNYDSYFIYDDFGRLLYELPAIFIFACNGNYQFQAYLGGTNGTQFDGYATAYRYDQRSRQIVKKKPGEEWSEYVYNNLNQVVLSKSPELSGTNDKWNFVKYDLLGRPIQTGFYTDPENDRGVLQSQCDAATTNLWETKTGIATAPYTTVSFPIINTSDKILTETYYDDYAFDINGYTYNYYGTPAKAQGKRTRGAVTGTKVAILTGAYNTYLTSVSYFDTDGRLAVQFAQNMLNGFDKVMTEYDYTGKVTKTTRLFRKASGSFDQLTVVNTFEYDHAGRPTKTLQQIGSDQEVVLSELVYNELGQVVKKHLHQTEETNSGMQIVDYRYNERGWLTKINNADLVNDGDNLEAYDVFGEELIYHEEDRYYSTELDMHRQFNGNIGAMKWKTNRAPEADGSSLAGHSYVFRYDKLGQMTGAFYASSSDTYIDDYSDNPNEWDEKLSYDANGNIRSILRKRGRDDAGNELGAPYTMDQLSFTYATHTNKVLTIQDAGLDTWIPNTATHAYTHFIDNNAGGTEYTYDTEGRMTFDSNKGLGFEYNHLDLVKRANEGLEAVNFVWDATGQKLAKEVGTTTTYYFNGIEYTNDDLTSLGTSEGIARTLNGGLNNGDWVYDYYLKDHLGNVRAIITEEGSVPVVEKVTVELEKRAQEDANFNNVSATEKDKPYLYPYDPADPTSQKVSELNSLSGKVIGPAKVLAIEAGETIDLSAKYWYTEAPGDPLTSVAEILAGTLLNLGAASSGIIPTGPETGIALLNNVSGDQFGAFNTFINDAFDDVDFSKPQAYLVYMYFDKEMNLDPLSSGVMQVGDANALGQLTKQGIVAKDDGFFYTYVTNRSAGKVNFDNMTIVHWAPMVRVVYDYYPYGLTWENPKLPTDPDAVHDHCYQDKEFQFAEFTTGHGLALYDFHARMYDPCTARWLVPDPAAQFANPYLAMGNNPVVGIDPDGEFVVTAMIVGAVVGAYIGGTMANNSMDPTKWDYSSGKTWAYMGVGAVIGAAVGYGLANGIGTVGIRPDYRLGSEQVGFGFDITVGINIGPVKLGMRFGSTYYSNGFSGTSGLETRTGFTVGVGKGFEYNVTHFESGETSQTTAHAKIQVGAAYFRYENDQMPFADRGDKYRTAAQEFGFGPVKFGAAMFTGDPDATSGNDPRPRELAADGKEYYKGENGSDPDKYRAGIGYIGFGNFKIGMNSEKIRHRIQNVWVHDTIGVPRFRQMPNEHPDTFHFSFGASPYTLY